MCAMIRHTVSEQQKSFWHTIIKILLVVLTINFLVEMTNFLPKKYAGITSITILFMATIACSYIINRKVAKYIYILIDDEIIFYKEIGRREKKILSIKMWELEWIKSLKEGRKQSGKPKRVYALCCKLKGDDVYLGQFRHDGNAYRFLFQPNEALLREINKQMKVKNQH